MISSNSDVASAWGVLTECSEKILRWAVSRDATVAHDPSKSPMSDEELRSKIPIDLSFDAKACGESECSFLVSVGGSRDDVNVR